MQFYNVHTHSFTMKNAPRKFLHLYLPGVAANIVDSITATKAGASSMSWLLSKLGNGSKRIASFLKIGKSADQLSVFENLLQQYDNPTMKFVALTMYMEKCGADASETGFEGQLEEIMKVKQQYPDNLLVFMGIDPRWKYDGKELRKTVESYFETKIRVTGTRNVYPFVGLKLYPSMGFYAFDERLKETFEWAADNGVPILSHCNYLGGIYTTDTAYIKGNLNPYDVYSNQYYASNFPNSDSPCYQEKKKFWKRILGTNTNTNNLNTCSYFLEPASFTTMIDYFNQKGKPLKICLAHFGGDEHILLEYNKSSDNNFYGMIKQNWCGQIRQLMTKYKTVYTDISYAVHNEKIHNSILQELDNKDYGDRILFGTDFFLTEREMPEQEDYTAFKNKATVQQLSNYKCTAWEQIANRSVETFLKSKYYNGKVI